MNSYHLVTTQFILVFDIYWMILPEVEVEIALMSLLSNRIMCHAKVNKRVEPIMEVRLEHFPARG